MYPRIFLNTGGRSKNLFPWKIFLPEKLINISSASQEICPNFMEAEGSLPHSQQTATCPFPKQD
jgi:hypothetical protein